MPTPEALARDNIDRLLSAAGWVISGPRGGWRTGITLRNYQMGVPPGDAEFLSWGERIICSADRKA